MKKYTFKYQEKLPEPEGRLQEEVLEKFKILQQEALGIFIDKNNHFQSCFIENGINGSKIMLGHKLQDLESGGKVLRGRQIESLTECFLDASNYGIMGAMQSMYSFDQEKKAQCDKCMYEIESRDGRDVVMCCARCHNTLQLKER